MEIIIMILGVVGFFVASIWLWEYLTDKMEKPKEDKGFDFDAFNDEHFSDLK